MCSKLFSRKGEKGYACSSPQNSNRSLPLFQEETDRNSTPFACEAYQTIVLFGVPLYRAQVLCAASADVSREVSAAQGVHGRHLRRAETCGKMYQYEWIMQRSKKTQIYQTSLIPLSGADGKVNNIISVTKEISGWGPAKEGMLKEGAPTRTFSQILLAARENEKRAIAAALHDEVGSSSIMLLALITLLEQDIKQGGQAKALHDLNQLNEQIRASMERIHAIVVALRPPSLDMDGALRGSIADLLENICPVSHLQYRFECEPELEEKGICSSVKILLYRLVQEALNNVLKHAHATHVTVSLERRQDRLTLSVSDDGIGFKREKRLSVKHVGLLSMRDSVRAVGGRLVIQTAPGKGTHIRAVCPCMIYEENI